MMSDTFPQGLSEDEMAYICVYLASNLNENYVSQSNEMDKDKVLIVGPDNMATAVLVEEQLRELLGRSFDFRVTSINKTRRFSLNDFVLVINIGNRRIKQDFQNVIQCEPMLTEENKQEIVKRLKTVYSFAYNNQILDILNIVKSNISEGLEENKMYFELFQYFKKKEDGNRGYHSEFHFAEKFLSM